MTLPLRLLGALPTNTRPPQSPGCRLPTGRDDVNTIGRSAVPTAWSFAPRMMKSDDAERVVVALDLRAGLNRQRRAVCDVDEALERVHGVGVQTCGLP